MPPIAIVFYSRTGTARTVSERLTSVAGWPAYEIRDVESRIGLGGDMRCIADNLLRRNPQFCYSGPALDQFEHVVLIAPVWLRSLAAPMRAFLRVQGSLIRAYSAICVMSGYGGFRAIDDIATILGSKPRTILLLKQYAVLAEECDAALCRFKEQTVASLGTSSGWDDSVLRAND